MSKRLTRISAEKLFPELSKLLNLEISAVLENGNTHMGKLTSFDHDHIVLKDPRDHSHKLALNELYEVVYDAIQL